MARGKWLVSSDFHLLLSYLTYYCRAQLGLSNEHSFPPLCSISLSSVLGKGQGELHRWLQEQQEHQYSRSVLWVSSGVFSVECLCALHTWKQASIKPLKPSLYCFSWYHPSFRLLAAEGFDNIEAVSTLRSLCVSIFSCSCLTCIFSYFCSYTCRRIISLSSKQPAPCLGTAFCSGTSSAEVFPLVFV